MKVICHQCLGINSIPRKESYKKANCGHCKASLLVPKPIEASGDELDRIINNSDVPVVVDFWAPWCGPCKTMGPLFEEVALLFPLKALFVKVNTQDEQFLASRFKIRSIPTLLVFDKTQEKERVSGTMDINSLEAFVEKHT